MEGFMYLTFPKRLHVKTQDFDSFSLQCFGRWNQWHEWCKILGCTQVVTRNSYEVKFMHDGVLFYGILSVFFGDLIL